MCAYYGIRWRRPAVATRGDRKKRYSPNDNITYIYIITRGRGKKKYKTELNKYNDVVANRI